MAMQQGDLLATAQTAVGGDKYHSLCRPVPEFWWSSALLEINISNVQFVVWGLFCTAFGEVVLCI